jgi:phosphatidate cytidylyltransferase
MLRWRLVLGTALIAAMAGLCWLDAQHPSAPGIWLLPIALVATVLATSELLDLLAAAGMHPIPWVVHLMNLLLVTSPWMWASEHLLRLFIPELMLNIGLPVLVIFVAEMCRYRKPGGNMANIAAGIFALVYVGMLLRSAVSLRLGWGIGALASWIIVVKMGDIGAYTVGRLIGRRKMAPTISPGKTIEGAAGALLFACLGSWLTFYWLSTPEFRWLVPPESIEPEPWWGWLAFGLLVGVAGMVGDLAESLLKRDVERKDSADWLPGFGGVLDILDSLLLSAPVACFCWATGMVGC